MVPKPVYVDSAELRKLFNEQQFTDKIRAGKVSVRVEKEWPAPPHLGFEEGTVSQLVTYIGGNGHLVAQIHRYKRPDGTLAASGLPDPKKLVLGGVLYVLRV
jgi:hypothetical protein